MGRLGSKRFLSAAVTHWNADHQPIARALTPPQQWYCDEALFKQESMRIFKKYPQYIGHTQQLTPRKGAYFASTLLNEPFIVVRQNEIGEADQIGSFFNVCRHHASPLTFSKHGVIDCQRGLKCPYHGWTYNIHGQLIKATQLNGIEDFKNKHYGLLSIPNQLLLDQLIFLDFSRQTYTSQTSDVFQKVVASVTQRNEEEQLDNKQLIHVYSRQYLLQCNWKVFVENYLDGGYHVPFLHLGLNANLNPDSYRTDIDGLVSFQSVQAAKDSTAGLDFSERIGDRALYTYIYPNFMINRYGRWMDVNYVYPKSLTECVVHFDYFVEATDEALEAHKADGTESESESESDLMEGVFYNLHRFTADDVAFVKDSITASHQVQMEDVLICEAVSRGLSSSAYRLHAGRYAPKLETALYQFHELYQHDMFSVLY